MPQISDPLELIMTLNKQIELQQIEIEKLQEKCSALEKKNDFYEETFSTLDSYQYCEKASKYIEKRKTALALTKLLNSVAQNHLIDDKLQEREIKDEIDKEVKAQEQIQESEKRTDDIIHNLEAGTDEISNKDYAVSEVENGLEITMYQPDTQNDIVIIPDHINMRPVIGIGENAFRDCLAKEVILPNKLQYIKDKAFYECRNLKKVEWSNNLISLGKYAFAKTELETICFPKNLLTISEGCFSECRSLQTVKLNNELRSIEKDAFESTAIESVEIPENVKSIGENAFGRQKYEYYSRRELTVALLGNQYISIKQGALADKTTAYCSKNNQSLNHILNAAYTVKPLSEYLANHLNLNA
jgi:hypothetical protein